jgi:GntR family transcriptional regulator, rspAB operon transcriptional repressor
MKRRIDTRLTEKAYSQLKAAIFEGRLPPGAPLSRRRLAEELDMSAVPVGDAILRLEGEGLIESRPRAGTRVRVATPEEIHGNYVLREALETHSARLFAESADARYRGRLLSAAEKLDSAYNALGRSVEYSGARHARVERVHISFHMLIAKAAKVAVLHGAIERSRVLLFNWIFTLSTEFDRFPERWHRDLADVLAHGSAGDAADAMRIHVRFRQEEVIGRFRALADQQAGGSRMVRGPQRQTLSKDGAPNILA